MNRSAISPCRPGHGASCALCCGSHNYAAGVEKIDALLVRRRDFYLGLSADYLTALTERNRSAMTGSYHVPEEGPPGEEILTKIFDDCTRCPYLAHKGKGGIIGCALHDDPPRATRRECVRSYSGKRFRCAVHDTLGDDEVGYAAMLAGDWYYYSILIHSAPILREIMAEHPSPGDVPPGIVTRLRKRLREEVHSRRELHAVHSYFGAHEGGVT